MSMGIKEKGRNAKCGKRNIQGNTDNERFKQVEGNTYNEILSRVVKYYLIRILRLIVNPYNLESKKLDIKTF